MRQSTIDSEHLNARQESDAWNHLPDGGPAPRVRVPGDQLADRSRAPVQVLQFTSGAGPSARHTPGHRHWMTVCDMADRMQRSVSQEWKTVDIQWVRAPVKWRALPFEEGTFDAVIASRVFEYATDLDVAFGELTRILKVGGQLIFDAPNPASWWGTCECHLRALTRSTGVRRALSRVRGLELYFTHLGLSENRFAVEEWESIATCYGLRSARGAEERTGIGRSLMLKFRKLRSRRSAAGMSIGVSW
jgi:SAM-dependent methyltransferase